MGDHGDGNLDRAPCNQLPSVANKSHWLTFETQLLPKPRDAVPDFGGRHDPPRPGDHQGRGAIWRKEADQAQESQVDNAVKQVPLQTESEIQSKQYSPSLSAPKTPLAKFSRPANISEGKSETMGYNLRSPTSGTLGPDYISETLEDCAAVKT